MSVSIFGHCLEGLNLLDKESKDVTVLATWLQSVQPETPIELWSDVLFLYLDVHLDGAVHDEESSFIQTYLESVVNISPLHFWGGDNEGVYHKRRQLLCLLTSELKHTDILKQLVEVRDWKPETLLRYLHNERDRESVYLHTKFLDGEYDESDRLSWILEEWLLTLICEGTSWQPQSDTMFEFFWEHVGDPSNQKLRQHQINVLTKCFPKFQHAALSRCFRYAFDSMSDNECAQIWAMPFSNTDAGQVLASLISLYANNDPQSSGIRWLQRERPEIVKLLEFQLQIYPDVLEAQQQSSNLLGAWEYWMTAYQT